MMLTIRAFFVLVAVSSFWIQPVFAEGDSIINELLTHPNKDVSGFYKTNQLEIEGLIQAIEDDSKQVSERLALYQELEEKYPDATEIVARQFVTDKIPEIALVSISILKESLVMSDHAHFDMASAPPALQYMMQSHMKSQKALRGALIDDREEIRLETAGFLASLSDKESLDLISSGVDNGLYSELEAANFYTLADFEIGQEYLSQYLGKGDIGAQETAVGYLGFYPEYQDEIRTTYFTNVAADPETRRVAAKTLSKYDPRFAEYALIVSNDENIDPGVYAATISGYVDKLTEQNRLDPNSAKILNQQVGEFKTRVAIPSGIAVSDLTSLEETLQARF